MLFGQDGIVTGTDGDDDLAYGDAGVNGNQIDDTGQTIFALAGNDDILAGWGNDTVYGGAGDDILHGDEGDDIVIGGIGSDTLTGGYDVDTFVFNLGDGTDTVTDFENGIDVIDFSETGLSFGDLNITTDANGSTIVSYGSGDQIELLNTSSQIDQSDFVFV